MIKTNSFNQAIFHQVPCGLKTVNQAIIVRGKTIGVAEQVIKSVGLKGE